MTQKSVNTRIMILKKAYSLFAHKGYNAVTMKDVCEETGLSRGGLYSHFGSTSEIFSELLKNLDQTDNYNYLEGFEKGKTATEVFIEGLKQLEKEMNSSEDSLSLAIYEYAAWDNQKILEDFAEKGKKVWQDIIEKGKQSGEFNQVNSEEISQLLMFAYQGVRMWSRIIKVSPDQISLILTNIKRQVLKKMNDILIRKETKEDRRIVENLVRESFWNVYRPGCTEHYVLHILRNEENFVQELNFVMEKNGTIIGQNVFFKTEIMCDDGSRFPILTMGPVCIANEYKRQGYGKILLDYSLEKAEEAGFGAVFFEGNIDFYGKSGFKKASTFGIRYHGMPDGVEADFFLGKELKPGYMNGITGVYATPKPYFAAEENPEKFEEFDREFPKKEKLKLPGQIA